MPSSLEKNVSLLQQLKSILVDKQRVEFSKVVPREDVSMALQAGLWISDPYSETGFSGAAVLSIEGATIKTYAPPAWSIVEFEREALAVLVVPVQPVEIDFFPSNKLPNTGLVLRVYFERYVFGDENIRQAIFTVKAVAQDVESEYQSVMNALAARQRVGSLYTSFKSERGAS